MGIIGGVLTGPITLIFPPLLYVRFRKLLHEERLGDVQKASEISKKNDFQIRIESQKESSNLTLRSAKESTGPDKPKYFYDRIMDFFDSDVYLNGRKPSVFETAFLFFVVGVGILQTVASTYYSAQGAIQSTKFLPPCIVNVEAASDIINA